MRRPGQRITTAFVATYPAGLDAAVHRLPESTDARSAAELEGSARCAPRCLPVAVKSAFSGALSHLCRTCLLCCRGSMTDQFQSVVFWIAEKQGARGHGRKRRLARTEAEGFQSSFVSVVALRWDLERQVIQRRSSWLVPVEPRLGKDVSPEVDQREQLRMTMPAKRRVDLLDREECNSGRAIGIGLRASLVASLTQQLEPENLLIEAPHSRQIANIENDLGNAGDRNSGGHKPSIPLTTRFWAAKRSGLSGACRQSRS